MNKPLLSAGLAMPAAAEPGQVSRLSWSRFALSLILSLALLLALVILPHPW